MTTVANLLGGTARLGLALFGLLILVDGGMQMFEYGEWVADLSRVEVAFLLIWAGLEWRCLKLGRAAGFGLLGCLISQLAWIAGLDLLGVLLAAIRGTGVLSSVWQMLAVLAAVQIVTPRPIAKTVTAETAA